MTNKNTTKNMCPSKQYFPVQNFSKFKNFMHIFLIIYRFGYFVFEQPDVLDFSEEGGPTDACSPNMSNGRGPFK